MGGSLESVVLTSPARFMHTLKSEDHALIRCLIENWPSLYAVCSALRALQEALGAGQTAGRQLSCSNPPPQLALMVPRDDSTALSRAYFLLADS